LEARAVGWMGISWASPPLLIAPYPRFSEGYPLVFLTGTCQYIDMVFGKFDLGLTSVSNSRYFKRSNIIWRRRKNSDGFTFTTRESVDLSVVQVHKDNNTSEPYQPTKLLMSIFKACEHLGSAHSDSWYLMQTVEIKLLDHLSEGMTLDSFAISDIVAETLKAFNTPAFLKYASFKGDLDKKQMQEILK
jgi:transcriptional regulator NrdR family protein